MAKVYPELVVYGPDGKIETVRYSMLSAMLLNELQKQNTEVRRLSTQLAEDKASRKQEIDALRDTFAERLVALEQAMRTGGGDGRLAAAAPINRWRPNAVDVGPLQRTAPEAARRSALPLRRMP